MCARARPFSRASHREGPEAGTAVRVGALACLLFVRVCLCVSVCLFPVNAHVGMRPSGHFSGRGFQRFRPRAVFTFLTRAPRGQFERCIFGITEKLGTEVALPRVYIPSGAVLYCKSLFLKTPRKVFSPP